MAEQAPTAEDLEAALSGDQKAAAGVLDGVGPRLGDEVAALVIKGLEADRQSRRLVALVNAAIDLCHGGDTALGLSFSRRRARREVDVELGSDAWIGVPHEPLNRGKVGAGNDEQRGRRVADVVKPERLGLWGGPQLHLALGAPAGLVFGREIRAAAPAPPADVAVAGRMFAARSARRRTSSSSIWRDIMRPWGLGKTNSGR